MRNFFILIPIFLILVGMVVCTSQPPTDNKIGKVEFYKFDTSIELTLEDINKPFSRQTLNLKPVSIQS